MNYFFVLTFVVVVTTAVGLTLIAEAYRQKIRPKLFVLLYVFLILHWADTGLLLVNEHITCTYKEKS